MKILSLQCTQGHGFEGRFGSEVEYHDQQTQGLLTCPLCGDSQVMKLPSAPRLNLHTNFTRRDDVPAIERATSCDSPPCERPPSDGTESADFVAQVELDTRCPYPRRSYATAATGTVVGHPSCVNRLRKATRTCNSTT